MSCLPHWAWIRKASTPGTRKGRGMKQKPASRPMRENGFLLWRWRELNSRPKNSAKSDYERIQLLRRVTAPCRPAHHTVDEAVHGPALVSLVSSRASADRTLALMTPSFQPTSTRPEWAGHPQVTGEVPQLGSQRKGCIVGNARVDRCFGT
jgi:hypothetical protein